MSDTPQVQLDWNVVVKMLREQISELQWENTILKATLQQAAQAASEPSGEGA